MGELVWTQAANQFDDHAVYWVIDPSMEQMRWHVSYQKAQTFGSTPGQILQKDGWYWYTADYQDNRFSSMFGPFSSSAAAMADCETAHKPEKR